MSLAPEHKIAIVLTMVALAWPLLDRHARRRVARIHRWIWLHSHDRGEGPRHG